MTKRMRPPPRRKADVSSAELAEMKRLKTEEGLTNSQIGGRFNLSPFSVRGLLKGVPSKAEAQHQAELQRQREEFKRQSLEVLGNEPSDDLSHFAFKPGGDRHE